MLSDASTATRRSGRNLSPRKTYLNILKHNSTKEEVALSNKSTEDDLIVEEYKSCRELISKNIEIIEKSEVYAVGAAAAIATFCLSATDGTVQRVSSWIPLAIGTFGLIRYIGLDSTIRKINNYLEIVEKRYNLIKWTTYYRSNNKYKVLKRSRYAIWLLLISCSGMLEAKIYGVWPFSSGVSASCPPTTAAEKPSQP